MHADTLGWLAAASMVATFSCREARRMRTLAVVTNLAFIGYGLAAALAPVLALHMLLLPINLWRWAEAWPAAGTAALRLAAGAAPLRALALACCVLLVACGGGGEAEPEPEPIAPLEMTGIYRQWEFKRYLGRFSREAPSDPVDHDRGGEVRATAQLGGYYLQPPRFDLVADQEIYSSASGMTYWAAAESPSGFDGADRPIGAGTDFSQQQMFVKQTEDATLEYVVSNVIMQGFDGNAAPADGNDCPIYMSFVTHAIWGINPDTGKPDIVGEITRPAEDGVNLDCDSAIRAWVDFTFRADKLAPDARPVLLQYAAAYVEVYGSVGRFDWSVSDAMFDHSWEPKDFETGLNLNNGMLGYALLVRPLVIKVPLHGVPVGGTIVVDAKIEVQAYDFRQRESSAHAFFRDPGQAGGAELRTTGLLAVPMTSPLPRLPDADPTPECPGPADAAHGEIAFERAAYRMLELPGLGVPVTLVRSGGASGEVSVQLDSTDGSASAATDFVDATQRVRFRDGQTRRTVRIRARLDAEAELDETVLLRLSQPRGCAALGALTEAVLTIHDDDHPLPPLVSYRIGGTVSGLLGPGLILDDREQIVNLAVAADGNFTLPHRYAPGAAYEIRIVSSPAQPVQRCSLVGPTTGVVQADIGTLQVVCEAPLVPSGLDPSFGTLGKVAQGLPGGARAIARQSSGHIVATNGGRLVRFGPDGKPDGAFGAGAGFVDNLLPATGGEVADLVVDADDRIVMAGRTLQPGKSPPYYQIAAARFTPDGRPDPGFGSGGMATVRLAGVGEQALRVQVLPDGRVLLVGQATFLRGAFNDADNDIVVVRLLADGRVDATFGTSGVVLADAKPRDFASAAALQPDGRLVVAGRTSRDNAENTDTVTLRLAPDGSAEPGFGRAPSFSGLDDEAVDLALMPDGRVVLLATGRGLNAEIVVARLNADGSFDTTFGDAGWVRADIGPHDDLPRAVALQADGRIVVAAQLSAPTGPPDFGLLRYAPDGTLDPTFGTGGVLRVDFFGGWDSANDILVQPDGRIVVAGFARSGLSTDLAMVRLVP